MHVPGSCEDEIICEVLNLIFVFHRILNSSSDVQINVILQRYQSQYVFISCSYHSLKILLLTQRTHYHGYLMLTHSNVRTQGNVHLHFLHILVARTTLPGFKLSLHLFSLRMYLQL